MNRVEISGGIVRSPDLRYTQNGTPILELNVAVSDAMYSSQAREQVAVTSYIGVVCFGWLADQVDNLGFGPGDEVHVIGRLDQTTVERPDGTKESKTKVRGMVVTPLRIRTQEAPRAARPADSDDDGEEPF